MKEYSWSLVIRKAQDPAVLKRMDRDLRWMDEERFLAAWCPMDETGGGQADNRFRDDLERTGTYLLTRYDPLYPQSLQQGILPPPAFYFRGDLRLLNQPLLAVVGSRKASKEDLRLARELGRLAGDAGIGGISGLALGIDGAFHRGCPWSIGVLGCGIDRAYPDRHRRLQQELERTGGLLSEFPPDAPPLSRNFPRRNRIIASLGTVLAVVAAGERSGALITLDYALDLGKEVFLGDEIQESGIAGGHELAVLAAALKGLAGKRN